MPSLPCFYLPALSLRPSFLPRVTGCSGQTWTKQSRPDLGCSIAAAALILLSPLPHVPQPLTAEWVVGLDWIDCVGCAGLRTVIPSSLLPLD